MFPDAAFVAEMPGDVAVAANELLEEVVENLLVNAVQHNDKPTPEVTVAVDADEETATLTVADNGPGVAPDMEAKLFDKGAKGFDSPGTGFGLHLVREIVEAYGGDVSVENLTPTGTKFTVTLPRADGDASAS
jgi:signal transduction histidine kinase